MGSWWSRGTSRIDAETRKLGQPRDPSINPIPAPQLAASPRVTSTHNPKPTARHPSADYLAVWAGGCHRRLEYRSARSGGSRPRHAEPWGTDPAGSSSRLARNHERSGGLRGAQHGNGLGCSAVSIDDRPPGRSPRRADEESRAAYTAARLHHRRARRGRPLRDVQEAASHADPRTTMRYDRARGSLDRHATYIVAAYLAASQTRRPGPLLTVPVPGRITWIVPGRNGADMSALTTGRE